MDYEKKYNEALKDVRAIYPNLKGDAKLAVEHAFPELRESEDERTKKELIEFIKSLLCNDAFDRYKLGSWITWLEKQKENPKSADSIPSDCVSDAKYEDRSPKHSDSDGTDIRDTPAYWKGWDDAMKQKEQNHPNGCFTCDEYKKGYEAGRLNGFTAGYNKAMKEVDQKEQKQEWSEEDEEMYSRIVRRYTDYEGVIMRTKEESVANKMLDAMAQEEIWLKERLKSLRPSWKPSEEQMEALEYVIRDYREDSCNATANYLQEILDHLKNM